MNELYISLFMTSVALLLKIYRDREVVLYTAVVQYVAFFIAVFVFLYTSIIMINWFMGVV